MWTFLVRFILRNRFWNLVVIFALTAFMAYQATKVQLSYEFAEMLPSDDSASIEYHAFKDMFGEDGSVMFIGIEDSVVFKKEVFSDIFDLTYALKDIDGVEEVVSIARVFHLVKNDSLKKFEFRLISPEKPRSQAESDSIRDLVLSYPFYEGLLYTEKGRVSMLMLTLDKTIINSGARFRLINSIRENVEGFCEKHGVQARYSGLPYIRTVTSKMVKNELLLFIFLSLLIAAVVLFLYFRTLKSVVIPVLIVAMGVAWVLGTMVLLGFKITILTGIIPPILIVIGIENCIFLINKYHFEFSNHGNKIKALSRIVQRVGFATLLTNLTTAVGFATFAITGNHMLTEFGLVASINIMVIFILSLFLLPILFSYISPPNARQTKHLENRFVNKLVEIVVFAVTRRRTVIYIAAGVMLLFGGWGISRLTTTGNIVDDISEKHPLYQDLLFFEKHFKGVMPLEISIDTRKKKGVMTLKTLSRISELQDSLACYPELSKPLSVAEVVKFAKQAFYSGEAEYYDIPNRNEMAFMADYIPKYHSDRKSVLNTLVDSTFRVARVSVQMANIGTRDIQRITDDLRPKIDSIFPPDKYDVKITGTSIVFLQGTDYLVKNLGQSLFWAILVISFLMFLLFRTLRMVAISIVPNLLPQIMTAAMMGIIGISIKPSTILIFSIALGISVDNAILFLSRYRHELKQKKWNINECVISALRETAYSMIYSSSVLFLGFSIFIISSFGGTQSLGYLISFTFLIAILCNLLLLPSILLTFGGKLTTKGFEEPVIEILDEEDDETESEDEINTQIKEA